MDSDWEQKYPLVSVRTLPRIESLSDHAPILLTTGIPSPPRKHPFKFELGWLQREGFTDMVKNIWDQQFVAGTPVQRWNSKFRAVRKYLGGWARHTAGLLRNEKLNLSTPIDELEAIAEIRQLTTPEIDLKNQYNAKLAGLLREEELKWYQRSKSSVLVGRRFEYEILS